MLMGAFWAIWGADRTGNWVTGVLIGMAAGGLLGLLHAFFSVHLRADQIIGGTAINLLAIGITGYAFVQLYGTENIPAGRLRDPTAPDEVPRAHPAGQPRRLPVRRLRATERDDLGRAPVRDHRPLRAVQDAARPPAAIRRRASARRRHSRHQRLRHALLRGDALRGARGRGRCVPVGRRDQRVQREHDGRPRLHRPRGRDRRQLAAFRLALLRLSLRLLDSARVPARRRLSRLGRRNGRPRADVPVRPDARSSSRASSASRSRRRRSAGRTRSSSVAEGGSSAAWGSLVAGLASCATLPLAVFLTRFSDAYDLLHAGFAIPCRRRTRAHRARAGPSRARSERGCR